MRLEIIEAQSAASADTHTVPLLFVHGAYHGAWCWKEHFLPFFQSVGYSSYALSLRGHGESEGRSLLDSYALHDYMEDVLQVIGTLRQKPMLVGHSMGGLVVQGIVHAHPGEIEGAVLLSSIPPNGMLKDFLRLLFTKGKLMRQVFKFNQGKQGAFPIELFLPMEVSDQRRLALSSMLQPESQTVSKECLKRFIRHSHGADVPMLVMGSKKDLMISEKSVRSTARFYGTEPILFAEMSHDMMLDPNWEQVTKQILAFLMDRRGVCTNEVELEQSGTY